MSVALRPCPFCGSTDIYHEYNETTGCYELACNQCGAWPYQEGRKDDVVRKWNRRAERTCRLVKDDCYWRCTECRSMFLTALDSKPKCGYCPCCGAKVVEE